MKKILMALLLTVQPALSAELNIEVKPPFVELEERMQMSLTDEFVDALRPFARNLGRRLDGILTHASELPSLEAEEFLVNSVKRMVYEGDIKYDEMLSREILERAILIHKVLLDETNSNDFGIVDMRIRLVTRAIELARDKYAGLDLAFFDRKEDVAYADFGKEYMQYLLELNKSVFDATAQYKLQKLALQFYQYDLSRDVEYESYATDIVEIHDSLPSFPDSVNSDRSALNYIRGLRSLVASLNNVNYRANRYTGNLGQGVGSYNPDAGYMYESKIEHEDGSVTLKGIILSRGNGSYLFQYSYSDTSKMAKGICERFGFDDYVSFDSGFEMRGRKAAKIDAEGKYVSTSSDSSFSYFEDINCYNRGFLNPFVITNDGGTINPDNSVTYNNIRLSRGENENKRIFDEIFDETDLNKVLCEKFGHRSFLVNSLTHDYVFGNREILIEMDLSDTKKYTLKDSGYAVESVTCID